MPSTDTTNSSPTSVGLLLQVLNTKSLDCSAGTFSFCDTNDINVLILFEDLVNFDFLFEEFVTKINFVGNSSTIDLDFKDVILLLTEVQFIKLGVGNNSDYCTVFLDSVQLDLD